MTPSVTQVAQLATAPQWETWEGKKGRREKFHKVSVIGSARLRKEEKKTVITYPSSALTD